MDLGAIETSSGEYCRPSNASKDKTYQCAECKQRVILRKGEIRRPHFAHYSKRECSYYEHPSESQIHKDAKYRLAEILKQKSLVSIGWQCQNTKCIGSNHDEVDIEYKDGDEVIVEYRSPDKSYIADVALVNNGKPRYIFEIKNTHATTTTRPEPWFEIDANELFEDYNCHPVTGDYLFSCVRRNVMRECLGCRAIKEPWIDNLPRLGDFVYSTPSHPCIGCNRKSYMAIFCRGYRRLCKMCLETDYENLKQKYDLKLKGRCAFI